LHGDARGRREGDTLAAETTNFTDKMEYQGSREKLRLIERFRRVSENEIEYRVTWRIRRPGRDCGPSRCRGRSFRTG
jgi:hypothetical protein